MEINVDPEDRELIDISVGNRSQAARQGVIPGKHFAHGGICTRLVLETLQTAMDFGITARYIGKNPEGLVFDMTVAGSAAIHAVLRGRRASCIEITATKKPP